LAWPADDAADVDDAPSAAAQHAAQRGAGEAERCSEVHFEHRVPVLVGDAQCQAVARQAGVIDQDHQRTGGCLGRFNQRLCGGRIGKVGKADIRAAGGLGRELLRERIQGVAAGAGQYDGGALGM
jgi:hypothetical protein